MNEYQARVKEYMDGQISQLHEGMRNLEEGRQPTEMGKLYNGMLKSNVSFEIRHMEHLREDLLKLLG